METIWTHTTDALTGLLESDNELRRLEDQLRSLRSRLDNTLSDVGAAGGNSHLGARLERFRARYTATPTGSRLAHREAYRRLGPAASQDQQSVAR